MKTKNVPNKFIILFLAIFLAVSILSASAQELVRAKVGMEILTDDKARTAKSRDRIKIGNQLRVLVIPERDSHVYVINSDRMNAFLLNNDQIEKKLPANSLEVYPSMESLYKPDGKGKRESFTIIFSLKPISEIANLFSGGTASHKDWERLEDKLTKKSKITLNDKIDKPFPIAGTVRKGLKTKNLKIYTGNEFLVKKFEFQVKK